ncbi:MAG: Fructose-bisphosphate aldolase [Firmicutes bacterium]|nr:Fructose-bisphosphate aldolase [Bacillota bacterium]
MKKTPLKHVGERFNWYKSAFAGGNIFVKLSPILMGAANIRYGQLVKGIGYLCMEIMFILFVVTNGASNLINLITLGSKQQEMVLNEKTGIFEVIQGDNSMLMLFGGVVTAVVIVFFIIVWLSSIKSGINTYYLHKNNKPVPGFLDDVKSLFDINIQRFLLFLPMVGLIIFTVLPLIYMITMAFTNYDVNHQPPGNLFNWVGLKNFKLLLMSKDALAKTFWPVLGWTIIWAVFATFTNYIGGMLLAILINKKEIKFKKVWRTIFVLTISIPSFIGLLVVRTMLNKSGIINNELINFGFITEPLPFLTSAIWARATVIIVNMWLGIPFTMLITTGILINIPADLYESAKIDGASPFKAFIKITFPYIFFITTPYLISNFISNVNNFNPIFFLTAGGPQSMEYFKGAGKTDLLVTWLYKLTSESKNYSYASAIGIVIFIISAILSLIVYRKSGAYNNEEGFQ